MATRKFDSLVCPQPHHPDRNLTFPPAVENLVPYSLSQPAIFKTNELLPVKDLKLLVRDYEVRSSQNPLSEPRPNSPQKIAADATTILINLTADREILEYLASDHEFVKTLLGRVTVCQSALSLAKASTYHRECRIPPNPMRTSYPCSSPT